MASNTIVKYIFRRSRKVKFDKFLDAWGATMVGSSMLHVTMLFNNDLVQILGVISLVSVTCLLFRYKVLTPESGLTNTAYTRFSKTTRLKF